jgi:hypothetical protein
MITYSIHYQTGRQRSLRLLRNGIYIGGFSFANRHDLKLGLAMLESRFNITFPESLKAWIPELEDPCIGE